MMVYGGGSSRGGPSPVIPFVLVSIVVMMITGPGFLMEMEMSIDYEMMDTYLLCAIPVLSFLIISFSGNTMIEIPLLLALMFILLQNVEIGPLILLVMIHFSAARYYSNRRKASYRPEDFPERRPGYDSCNSGNCYETRFIYDSCNTGDSCEGRFRHSSLSSGDDCERRYSYGWWNSGGGCEDDEIGLGFYLLMLLFFILYGCYTYGEEDQEYGWLPYILLPSFLIFFHWC